MQRLGIWAAYAAAFTLTWNGWYVGPVRPGDVLVLVSLVLLGLGASPRVFPRMPWWVWELTLVVLVLVALLVLFPPDAAYLTARLRLDAGGAALPSPPSSALSNLGTGGKFLVGVTAIPLAFGAAAHLDDRAAGRLGVGFALGTALSGFAAFVDHLHVASIGSILTGIANVGDRQAGFTSQPDFLAAGLVLAIPFAVWMTVRSPGLSRWAGAAALLFLLLGTYSSGSRGGAVAAVVTLFVSLAALPRTRRFVLPAVAVAATVVIGIVVVEPGLGVRVLTTTRLTGGSGAGSSAIRGQLAHQGLQDFLHFPFYGVGLQFGTDASVVYLQFLAAGGLLLFVGALVYLAGAAASSWRRIGVDPLAAAVFAAVVATVLLDFVEADLTDRFYYVPEAILVALLVRLRARPRSAGTGTRVAAAPERSGNR